MLEAGEPTNSKWSFHGPGLSYRGGVWNGDKTKIAEAGLTYIAKSVMTGKDSFYPESLPQTLKSPYVVPDSTHPKLAFWYEPGSAAAPARRGPCPRGRPVPDPLLAPPLSPGTPRTLLSATGEPLGHPEPGGKKWPKADYHG